MNATGNRAEQTARPWLLVTTAPSTDCFGAAIPPGTAVAREMWDGRTRWHPPDGLRVVEDDGRPLWQPASPPPPPPTELDAYTWLRRMEPEVHLAVARAAQADPRLLVALTLLGARGMVDLHDPTGQLRAFLDLAVELTAAMPDRLTPEAAAAMLRP